MIAVFGVSFLTPLDGLFALLAIVPLGAFLLIERRAERIRRVFAAKGPARSALVPVVVSLVLLPVLLGVASAQPVVVHRHLVTNRADAQVYFILDTSESMQAASGPGQPSRLARAKRIVLRLHATMPDVPTGIASMTDRVLPNLLPTTDATLFDRTLSQSVAIDSPPPSQRYPGRATDFSALAPLVQGHFFSSGVVRRLVIVLTDGEAQPIPPILGYTLQRQLVPIYVHVWASGERIYGRNGRASPRYSSDPTSASALDQLAHLTSGKAFDESQVPQIAGAARADIGQGGTRTEVSAYARVALAPWFLILGVLPLGYLLWRRNV